MEITPRGIWHERFSGTLIVMNLEINVPFFIKYETFSKKRSTNETFITKYLIIQEKWNI
jgi:hypothetical protein